MLTPNELYLQGLRTKQGSLQQHLNKYEHVTHYKDMDNSDFNRYIELRRDIRTRLSEIETDIAMAERSQTNDQH